MDIVGLLQPLPYSALFILIHAAVHLHTLFLQYFLKIWRRIVEELKSTPENDFREIRSVTKEMKKIPNHVAYCLDAHKLSLNQTNNVKALSKLISWSWASGTSIVSVYDTEGQIRDNSTELEIFLEKAIGKLRTKKSPFKLEIKFHNVSKTLKKNLEGIEKLETKNMLHIIVFSPDDGKQGVADAVKKLIQITAGTEMTGNNNQVIEEESTEKDEIKKIKDQITETKINGALDVSMEPDLLVIFGSSSSTLGFLPWHIRLTEIHWLPMFPTFNSKDFASILQSYSACDQKVGK